MSWYEKGETNLDFTEARDSELQWHQLGHMQVCTSLQTHNHASIPPLSFFTGRMPFLPPNQQRQSTEGTNNKEETEQRSEEKENTIQRKAVIEQNTLKRTSINARQNCTPPSSRKTSGVTSHRQPRQCRGAQGPPKTVKGAQSDPNYVSRLLLDRVPVFHKIITPAYLLYRS